jgi:hypothetical protein
VENRSCLRTGEEYSFHTLREAVAPVKKTKNQALRSEANMISILVLVDSVVEWRLVRACAYTRLSTFYSIFT